MDIEAQAADTEVTEEESETSEDEAEESEEEPEMSEEEPEYVMEAITTDSEDEEVSTSRSDGTLPTCRQAGQSRASGTYPC